MRFQLRVLSLVFVIPFLQGRLQIGRLAAQEIPQCYVETIPCGTPEHMQKLISECLQDPGLCRDAKQRHEIFVDLGSTGSAPASIGGSSELSLAVPLQSNPAGSSPTLRPMHGHPTVILPQTKLPTVDAALVTRNNDTDGFNNTSNIMRQITRDLPLELPVRNLNDTMPPDAAAVERRLGLRRTRVAGVDLRRKVPLPEEIVQALAP